MLGTPFHHQGRLPGAGLDCLGLVVCSLRQLGHKVTDETNYGRRGDGVRLIAALEEQGALTVTTINPGNLLVFRFGGMPQHLAIATADDQMIHAYAPVGKVVETSIGQAWQSRLVAIYALGL